MTNVWVFVVDVRVQGLVELLNGVLILLQAISPCSLLALVAALGPQPLVVALRGEGSLHGHLHSHLSELGLLLGRIVLVPTMAHEVLAWCRIWRFVAPPVDVAGVRSR